MAEAGTVMLSPAGSWVRSVDGGFGGDGLTRHLGECGVDGSGREGGDEGEHGDEGHQDDGVELHGGDFVDCCC